MRAREARKKGRHVRHVKIQPRKARQKIKARKTRTKGKHVERRARRHTGT